MIDYATYLESEAWRAKASEAMSRAQWACQVCCLHSSKASLEVHHRSYRKLGKPGEMADLICLCADCHGLYHEHGTLAKEPTA